MISRNSTTSLLRKTRGWGKAASFALLGMFGSGQAMAQQGLATYTPSRTTGITYTSISATGIAPAFYRNGTNTDDNLTTFLPIGFNFIYDGVQVNAFQMSTNGFINLLANTGALGGSGAYGFANDNNFTSAGSSVRVIAPFYDDHQTAGNLGTLVDLQNSMKYQTTGSPGSRICTIEWVGIQDFNSSSTSSYNFQIQLFETSNNIAFIYGTMVHGGPGTRSFSVGLNSSTLSGISPFVTTMLFTQQVANTATFGGTAQNIHPVASLPASLSQILFTYGGAAPAPMSGAYTIPGSFANFTAAINSLNYNGVSGATTFNVAAGSTFVETPPTLQVGVQTSAITFQKSGAGANPIISATGGAAAVDAGIRMWGGNGVTFDGIDVTAAASTLEFGYMVQQYTNLTGAQNNTFKNCTITLNRTSTSTIGILQTSILGPVSLTTGGANSNNTYENITIRNSYAGMQLNGGSTVAYNAITQNASPDNNNRLTSTACGTYNIIGDPLTPNDIGNGTVATYGVFMSQQANFVVENTRVQNVTSNGAVRVDGIVANCNLLPAATSGGISTIRNNQIFTLRSTNIGTSVVAGVRLNNNGNAGTNLRVHNNFIGDLSNASTSTTSRRILGISLQDVGTGNPSTVEIWHNSVRLTPAGISCNNACLELLTSTTGPVVTVRNNIFSNETAAQVTVKHYCLVSSSATVWGATGSSSNFNDLHIANATNGFVGLGATTDYALLANWTAGIATPAGTDANSKSVAPVFLVGPNDLHLDVANLSNQTNLFGAGAALPGYITNDIDCLARAAAPTMGADEIIAGPCSGLPAANTSSTTTPTRCAGQTAALTNNAFNFAAGIVFQWQVGDPGGPYADVVGGSGATTQAYATGVLTTGTYEYILRVRCTNDIIRNGDFFSNGVTITVIPTPSSLLTSNSPVCTGATLTLLVAPMWALCIAGPARTPSPTLTRTPALWV